MRVAMLALAISGTLFAADVAKAQDASQVATSAREFDVPEGALSAALVRFGEQAGLQFNVGSSLTDGRRTAGLRGRYTPEEGLRALLAGSGLTFRYAGPRTVVIEAAPDTGDARVLGPLRIEGSQTGVAVNGINGSTDVTATEGTGSYTTGAMSIASKVPMSIKDTPQSVSVITHQQMQDQNLTDFGSLLDQATGITTVAGLDPFIPTWYSRGFILSRLQVDGGAPIDIATPPYNLIPQIDLSIFDHAELLRGADGLFNGFGNPGGVINLTRKRPLDHRQIVVEGEYGSWNNVRATLDATAPLGFGGRLRGRTVLVWQDHEYFYDYANLNKTVLYGVLEADVGSTTMASVGASRSRQDARPFYGGLPRYADGADLNLPRETSLIPSWSRHATDTDEVFIRLDQGLGANWALRLNLTHLEQESRYKYGYSSGAVNPVTLQGPVLQASMEDRKSSSRMADFTLDGSFELFGHAQQLLVGGNYSKYDGGGWTVYGGLNIFIDPVTGLLLDRAIDVFDFDPSSYPEPADATPSSFYPAYGIEKHGAYAKLRLTLLDPLHVALGMRHSRHERFYSRQLMCISAVQVGCENLPVGSVYQSNSAVHSHRHTSWPAAVSVSWDFSEALTGHVGYTDIYEDQSSYIDAAGTPLGPATGSNLEAGLKWAGHGGRLNASFALYRIRQKNFAFSTGYEAVPGATHVCCYENSRDMIRHSEGVDLELTGELLPGLQVSAGYTFNRNEYLGDDYGDRQGLPMITRQPRHLLKFWGNYSFQGDERLRRLSLGAGVNAQTRSYHSGTACTNFYYFTTPGGEENAICIENSDFDFSQGFYALFSARAGYRIDDRWDVALNLNNLFDRRYYQTVSIPSLGNRYGEPRNFALRLRGIF